MCELLAISSAAPIRVRYSLEEFAKHGGLTHLNKSGWGISFYHERDAEIFREPRPASDSALAEFVAQYEFTRRHVLAHVRRASIGQQTIENTHPFDRELHGRKHIFAHNGSLHELPTRIRLASNRFLPVGETDSEYAFCVLLERVVQMHDAPSLDERLTVVVDFAAELRELGDANFLYFDGEVLFAHAHKRHHDDGTQVVGPARPPGLHFANHASVSIPGLDLTSDPGVDAAIVASVPLTDMGWTPLAEGAVIAIRDGRKVAHVAP
ncbi:MAG: class II glutamine amidotransferase [Myxococcota bacterium]